MFSYHLVVSIHELSTSVVRSSKIEAWQVLNPAFFIVNAHSIKGCKCITCSKIKDVNYTSRREHLKCIK